MSCYHRSAFLQFIVCWISILQPNENLKGILNSYHPCVHLRFPQSCPFIYYLDFTRSKRCTFLKILFFHYPIYFDSSFHCVKGVCIRSYSGLHFPAFGVNTERCKLFLFIQSECKKIWTRITPNTDTFHAVFDNESFGKNNIEEMFIATFSSVIWSPLL